MTVVVSYFTKKTREEFLRSLRTNLGKKDRLNRDAGTIVVLSSLDEKIIWGVCVLANWPGTDSPCRERHLLDEEVYSKEFAACNKYEICISNLRILSNPVCFNDVMILVGGSPHFRGSTNMWKGFHQYAATFIEGDDKSCVTRFNIWIKSLL